MTLTNPRLFTTEEYHRMSRAGIFSSDERLELIEGQILLMAAKNPPHSATNLCAANILNLLLQGKALIRVQDPVVLDSFNEPEPDIAVVTSDPQFYLTPDPNPLEIFLLIEVADTTLARDCEPKAILYAKASIPDYWVLDVNNRLVYQLREPSPNGYN